MTYGNIASGYIRFAPRRMKIGSVIVYNPTDAQLLAEGFLPVVETDAPEVDERHEATPHWTIQKNRIVQSWSVEEIPITDEEALTRYANELTGADDPDLTSAAETLIEQRIKEEQ